MDMDLKDRQMETKNRITDSDIKMSINSISISPQLNTMFSFYTTGNYVGFKTSYVSSKTKETSCLLSVWHNASFLHNRRLCQLLEFNDMKSLMSS
jgi:hypothetical protein